MLEIPHTIQEAFPQKVEMTGAGAAMGIVMAMMWNLNRKPAPAKKKPKKQPNRGVKGS